MSRPAWTRAFATSGRAVAIVASIALGVLLTSCAGVEDLSGTGGSGSGAGGGVTGTGSGSGGTVSSSLLGSWTRIVLLAADDGNIHESRTTWEVRQDGSAIRTVLAWNLSAGFYDTVVTVAQWRTNGSQLTITYLAPSTGTAAFTYSVNGDILTIGPDQFSRVR